MRIVLLKSRIVSGLLVVGGSGASYLAEFWSPEPKEVQCDLQILKRDMSYGPTVNLLDGVILACFANSCDQLTKEGWQAGPSTTKSRRWHTSAVLPQGLLLLGGFDSPDTTELLTLDGGAGRESFSLIPGRDNHCSVQVDATTVVLIGGKKDAKNLATEYSGLVKDDDPIVKQLPELLVGREGHACGTYHLEGRQVVANVSERNPILKSVDVVMNIFSFSLLPVALTAMWTLTPQR